MAPRRSATYVSTLVYVDEPQLLLLKSYKTNVVALAVASQSKEEAKFIAATVTGKDLALYMDGHVDLRYLFTYPTTRSIYTFNLMSMSDNKVLMDPFEDNVPAEYLPSPRFFSTSHTEDSEAGPLAAGEQQLVVDGEWDMPDFGEFYSRYSDIYYFLSATDAFNNEDLELNTKKKIKKTFTEAPFKGGFSYVNFYSALPGGVAREGRLRMDKIKYESPGYVKVNGDPETFAETESIIRAFLKNRAELRDLYSNLHLFLSKRGYLRMSANDFDPADPAFGYIDSQATLMAETLSIPTIGTLRNLVDNNALAFAKIVLSLYRRLDDTARYFAQGRMNFT